MSSDVVYLIIPIKTEPKESGERGLSNLGGLRWKDRLAQKGMNKR